jgi:SAM-dependent methyltransferase
MNATSEWWETFFHGPWGKWQANGFAQQNTRAEADFLFRCLGLQAGDAVLDVACGTGRHAIELAERGVDVTGIDFNARTLEVARSRAAASDVAVEWVKQDMRCLRFRDQFDAAYCFWTSFGYFEDENHDLVVAKRVAEALKPGGRFLIDIAAIETILPIFEGHRSHWLDDDETCQLIEDVRFDCASGRVEADWTFVEGGQSCTSHSSIRLYSYRELCELLREAGFRRFAGYDTRTGEPFALGSKRLALVASLA